MKKFLAIALAALMIAALAVPAFAADMTWTEPDGVERTADDTHYGVGNDDPASDNYLDDAEDSYGEDTIVKYGVAQAYIVTIPAEIRLHQAAADTDTQTKGGVYGYEKLGVSDVVIANGEEICIYVSSANYGTNTAGRWTLIDEDYANAEDTINDDDHKSVGVDYVIVANDINKTDANNNFAAEDEVTEKWLKINLANGKLSLATDGAALVVSGNGENATARNNTDGCVLKQSVATGNIGTTGSGKTVELYFSSLGTAQEGNYKDTLTFTVRIQDVVVTES